LRRQRTGERHDVGLRQKLGQPVMCVDGVRSLGARVRIATRCDHAHVESPSEPRQARANAADPHDQQGFTVELVFACGDFRDHATPHFGGLVVATRMQLPLQRQDQRHGMLRDSLGIHPRGACQAYAALANEIAVVLIETGADRLDELQITRDGDELVAPHHGDDDDMGLGNACLEFVERVHLEVGDARTALGEPLGHAVGRVGETDF
jgi:hypothetical protein